MPLLQVRNVPEDLYEELTHVAQADNRSISQETIVLLRKALDLKDERKLRRQRVFQEIKSSRLSGVDDFPDPADFIREDRDR